MSYTQKLVDSLREIPRNPTFDVAENTEAMAADIERMVAAVTASLKVSEDMRDHAREATDAAKRSGTHALIVAYVSSGATLAALVVAVIALVISIH